MITETVYNISGFTGRDNRDCLYYLYNNNNIIILHRGRDAREILKKVWPQYKT